MLEDKPKLKVLDLFSGILAGGFSLGLERTGGFETVAFCEIEPFPRRVLAKHWPGVPIHTDVKELRAEHVGPVDVICGGYPCQPFSTAGKRMGQEDDRHLWPDFARLVDELRPAWVIGENVAGHVSMGLDDVLSDLESKGYTARPFIIPACAANLPHRRDRVWIVANSGVGRFREPQKRKMEQSRRTEVIRAGYEPAAMAHAECVRRQGQGQPIHASDCTAGGQGEAAQPVNGSEPRKRRFEPSMGRMADGFSPRLDEPRDRVTVGTKDRAARLKALGNAVVPAIPEMIGRAILAAEAAE